VLAPAPTFFAAHAMTGGDVFLFVVLVLLVPAAVLFAGITLVDLMASSAADWAFHVIVGLLAALAIAPILLHSHDLRMRWFLSTEFAIAALVVVLHRATADVRTFLSFTSVFTAGISVWFLAFSPASALLRPASAVNDVSSTQNTNVVMVVFDETPLAALLQSDGKLDARRFPGFAELAADGTWYRNARTVAPWTHLAVPAILSGQFPQPHAAPISATYPHNFFSMLQRTHTIRSFETVTFLCSSSACGSGTAGGGASLYNDATVVYLHSILPAKFAASRLPPVGNQWANFHRVNGANWIGAAQAASKFDQKRRFRTLLDSLRERTSGQPTAWFAHFLLPHLPLRYLPDGREYQGVVRPFGLGEDWIHWTTDRGLLDVARQRYMLQLKYVDRLISTMMHTLKSRGLYQNTMVIVTSDHGLSFEPGLSRRASPLTPRGVPDILPVPMFVKYPGQRTGVVDGRFAQTIDLLPTIADVLHAELPRGWQFDGRSLLARPIARHMQYVDPNGGIAAPDQFDNTVGMAPYHELFGDWRSAHDLYAWGPHRDLVGEPAARGIGSQNVVPLEPTTLKYVPTSAKVPALVTVQFAHARVGAWFAVEAHGVVVGLGRVYADGDARRGVAMVDPSLLSSGMNRLSFLLWND
jgi:hypothetical protein